MYGTYNKMFPSKGMPPDLTPLCVSVWCTSCEHALNLLAFPKFTELGQQ